MYKCTHEIAVYDTCGVDILQATTDLVEEVLDELLLEGSGGQQPVQVRPQQLGDEVDIFEGRDKDVAERDDILVPEVLEQFQLTVGPLGQDGGAEGLHDLLDRDARTGQLVLCRAWRR